MFKKQLFVWLVCVCWVFPAWGIAEDPTRPPIVKNKSVKPETKQKKIPKPKTKTGGWVLSSTLVASDRRTAVINDKVLSVGEKIDGAKVVGIQSGKVLLRRKNKTITLEIVKKDVKIKVRLDARKPSRKNGK